jgi:hypothetical protein
VGNDPERCPFVIVTTGSLAVQSDKMPVTFDGLDPPPELLSGGENLIVAVSWQLTEPGADPSKCAGAAEAGDIVKRVPASASTIDAATGAPTWHHRGFLIGPPNCDGGQGLSQPSGRRGSTVDLPAAVCPDHRRSGGCWYPSGYHMPRSFGEFMFRTT